MKDGELGQKIKKIRQGFRVRDESTESASPTDRSKVVGVVGRGWHDVM